MNADGLSAATLRARFDAATALTVGIEEELMLLDPRSGDLAPRAREVVEMLGGDRRFKLELPAAQLEIVTGAQGRLAEAIAELRAARADLAAATAGTVRPAAAGTHPTAAPEGELNPGRRYERIEREYGAIANRQLVCALQLHVAPGSAERGLAIYNALRCLLPEIAALAANAPFHGGRDTGMASVRPQIAEQLPRQGIPPVLSSWDAYAAELGWGRVAGAVPEPGAWWWELRPHPCFGTLELRVADAQTTVGEAAAVAGFGLCLVAWLGDRFETGEPLEHAPRWRIEENRWRAARDGVRAELADLRTGAARPARERIEQLCDQLGGVADRLGCRRELEDARALAAENGSLRQRAVATERGLDAVGAWLADRWLR